MSGARPPACRTPPTREAQRPVVPNSCAHSTAPSPMPDTTANASAFPTPRAEAGADRPPRPAATIVVVRDGARGIEVLLSRRAERGDHTSGAWVFPGGIVDAGRRGRARSLRRPRRRRSEPAARRCTRAASTTGSPPCASASRSRDCCSHARGGEALVDLDGADAARLGPWRGALHRGERTHRRAVRDARACASPPIGSST